MTMRVRAKNIRAGEYVVTASGRIHKVRKSQRVGQQQEIVLIDAIDGPTTLLVDRDVTMIERFGGSALTKQRRAKR